MNDIFKYSTIWFLKGIFLNTPIYFLLSILSLLWTICTIELDSLLIKNVLCQVLLKIHPVVLKKDKNVKNTDTRTDKQDDQKKLMWALRMTLTQNEKKSTDDNERPSIVSYRPLIVVFYFSLSKNVGQWHTFWVKNSLKKMLHYEWDFLNCKNTANN